MHFSKIKSKLLESREIMSRPVNSRFVISFFLLSVLLLFILTPHISASQIPKNPMKVGGSLNCLKEQIGVSGSLPDVSFVR